MKSKSNFLKDFFVLSLFCIVSIRVAAVSTPVKTQNRVKINKTITGINGIFRSIDYLTLRSVVQTQNSNGANAFYNSFGVSVASYLESVYAENFLHEVEDMPEAMVVLGMFRWGLEHNVGTILVPSYANDDDKAWGCFVGAVSGIIGISDVVGLYNEFKNGASAKTILRGLKTVLRRVATVFTIVSSVIGLGSCMGWW